MKHNHNFWCGVRTLFLLLAFVLSVMAFLFHSSECIAAVYVQLSSKDGEAMRNRCQSSTVCGAQSMIWILDFLSVTFLLDAGHLL